MEADEVRVEAIRLAQQGEALRSYGDGMSMNSIPAPSTEAVLDRAEAYADFIISGTTAEGE